MFQDLTSQNRSGYQLQELIHNFCLESQKSKTGKAYIIGIDKQGNKIRT